MWVVRPWDLLIPLKRAIRDVDRKGAISVDTHDRAIIYGILDYKPLIISLMHTNIFFFLSSVGKCQLFSYSWFIIWFAWLEFLLLSCFIRNGLCKSMRRVEWHCWFSFFRGVLGWGLCESNWGFLICDIGPLIVVKTDLMLFNFVIPFVGRNLVGLALVGVCTHEAQRSQSWHFQIFALWKLFQIPFWGNLVLIYPGDLSLSLSTFLLQG